MSVNEMVEFFYMNYFGKDSLDQFDNWSIQRDILIISHHDEYESNFNSTFSIWEVMSGVRDNKK